MPAQYAKGTVTVAYGDQIVTGAGTSWAGEISSGDMLLVDPAGPVGIVASVQSDTSLTLEAPWPGVDMVGASYAIHRDFDPVTRAPLANIGDIQFHGVYNRGVMAIAKGPLLRYRAANSIAARSAAERAGDFVNVRDFGAIGDGLADDGPAFLAARAYSGATIEVPVGTYRFAHDIVLTGSWRFAGGIIRPDLGAYVNFALGANAVQAGRYQCFSAPRLAVRAWDGVAPLGVHGVQAMPMGTAYPEWWGDEAGDWWSAIMAAQYLGSVVSLAGIYRIRAAVQVLTGTWMRGEGTIQRPAGVRVGADFAPTSHAAIHSYRGWPNDSDNVNNQPSGDPDEDFANPVLSTAHQYFTATDLNVFLDANFNDPMFSAFHFAGPYENGRITSISVNVGMTAAKRIRSAVTVRAAGAAGISGINTYTLADMAGVWVDLKNLNYCRVSEININPWHGAAPDRSMPYVRIYGDAVCVESILLEWTPGNWVPSLQIGSSVTVRNSQILPNRRELTVEGPVTSEDTLPVEIDLSGYYAQRDEPFALENIVCRPHVRVGTGSFSAMARVRTAYGVYALPVISSSAASIHHIKSDGFHVSYAAGGISQALHRVGSEYTYNTTLPVISAGVPYTLNWRNQRFELIDTHSNTGSSPQYDARHWEVVMHGYVTSTGEAAAVTFRVVFGVSSATVYGVVGHGTAITPAIIDLGDGRGAITVTSSAALSDVGMTIRVMI